MSLGERREFEFISDTKLELSVMQLKCSLIFKIFIYNLVELLIHRGKNTTRIVPRLKKKLASPSSQNVSCLENS